MRSFMNAPTIIVGLVLLAVVAAIVVRGIVNKKRHKGGCGCGCDHCAGKDMCHPEQ